MLSRVEQEESNGCFIAAAASLLGKSYWKTRVRFIPKGEWNDGLQLDAALSRLGKLLGKHPKPTKTRRIRRMKPKTLLVLTWDDRRGHAVLWTGKKIIDPAKKHPWALHSYEKHLHKAYQL